MADGTRYLIIRADAGAKIGAGHLMRCLALGQSWRQRGGACVFVTNCESEALREKLINENFTVVELNKSYPHASDLEKTGQVLTKYPNAWCVIDGYHFDAVYTRAIRQSNRVFVVDDTAHLPFYDADAILNQNINADRLHYNCPKDTILLLGTNYALLRSEFSMWRDWRKDTSVLARKILITMGGGDFHNQTLKAIRAVELSAIENLEAKVVIGTDNLHYTELEKYVGRFHVHIELIKSAKNMPELMAWADVCVSAAGSTCWELAFMRLPPVLIVTAENQLGLAQGLSETGFAENSGWFEQNSEADLSEILSRILPDEKRRCKMSEAGRTIVDGYGAKRVAEFLEY